MTYRAPVDDILFNIFAVAPGPASPEVPAEMRDDWRTILEQAAVLVEETIAPLNRTGPDGPPISRVTLSSVA